MEIRKLTRREMEAVYLTRVMKDFPRSERKPLAVLKKCLCRGIYEPLALFDGTDLAGYAFFMRQGNDYLLDYLATNPVRRNCGLGSKFLSLLSDKLKDARTVMLEAEDPAFAKTDADRDLQTRRIGFYARNAFVDTGITAVTYGVHYRILTRPQDAALPADTLRALYFSHYSVYLGDFVCRRVIKF